MKKIIFDKNQNEKEPKKESYSSNWKGNASNCRNWCSYNFNTTI